MCFISFLYYVATAFEDVDKHTDNTVGDVYRCDCGYTGEGARRGQGETICGGLLLPAAT